MLFSRFNQEVLSFFNKSRIFAGFVSGDMNGTWKEFTLCVTKSYIKYIPCVIEPFCRLSCLCLSLWCHWMSSAGFQCAPSGAQRWHRLCVFSFSFFSSSFTPCPEKSANFPPHTSFFLWLCVPERFLQRDFFGLTFLERGNKIKVRRVMMPLSAGFCAYFPPS